MTGVGGKADADEFVIDGTVAQTVISLTLLVTNWW